MEKTAELLLKAWNSIKSGSLTIELAQNICIAKVSIDTNNFQLDIFEPKNSLLQALKTFIQTKSAQFAIPELAELEKLSKKEKLSSLKVLLKTLEPYAEKLSLQNKNFVLKYRGKEILVIGANAKAPLLKFIGLEKIALPNKLALLKFIKELKI
ncbi:MAG: hypothetical protein QMD21_00065 [Candidatus Thermoplasmatota archaeon]|nr:hypothetical protein [Candidatus Thermoplasmatota archaeon]MDI6855167.1 hypothetical protein [Candidatus Thermoplasmatota archaeon]